jgi:hypothetical protein
LQFGDVSRDVREGGARAEARYDELVARHPKAFAHHAAEFWLEAGDDPHRALRLARTNLDVRQSPRAYELFKRATILRSNHCKVIPAHDGCEAIEFAEATYLVASIS